MRITFKQLKSICTEGEGIVMIGKHSSDYGTIFDAEEKDIYICTATQNICISRSKNKNIEGNGKFWEVITDDGESFAIAVVDDFKSVK